MSFQPLTLNCYIVPNPNSYLPGFLSPLNLQMFLALSFLHPKPIQIRGTLCKQSGFRALLTRTHKCVLAALPLASRQPELSWHSKLMHRSWPELLSLKANSKMAPYHPRISLPSSLTSLSQGSPFLFTLQLPDHAHPCSTQGLAQFLGVGALCAYVTRSN